MFFKVNNTMFMFMVIISTIMVMSSSNWIMSWVCLEINLMVLIPLLIYKINFNNASSSMKYFLVQAMASILIILTLYSLSNKSFFLSMVDYSNIMTVALMLKLGMPPFQFWVTQVIEVINMNKIFLILVWQKISPLILLSYSPNMITLLSMVLSALLGCLGGINQNNMKKILFYSSLSHLAWMMTSLLISEKTWMIYFLVYTMLLTPIMFFCYKMKILMISHFIKLNSNKLSTIMLIASILSLAGLPPFLGFHIKISIISLMFYNKWLYVMSIPLIISTLVSMFYYFKISWSVLMLSSSKMSFTMNLQSNYKMNKFLFMALTMNLITPLMVF